MPAFLRRISDRQGRVFSCRAGQGSKSSGRGGAEQGKGQNLQGDAGQNLSISADLDHLLKEGNLDLYKTVYYDLHANPFRREAFQL